jgi:hypothetical protein
MYLKEKIYMMIRALTSLLFILLLTLRSIIADPFVQIMGAMPDDGDKDLTIAVKV